MSALKLGIGLLIAIPIVKYTTFKTLAIPATLLAGMAADSLSENTGCDFTKAAAIGSIVGNLKDIANAIDVMETR